MIHRSLLRVLVLLLIPLNLSCFLWSRAQSKLSPQVLHEATSNTCMAVLLPGRWDRVGQFRETRFGEAVRDRGLAMDVVAVDAYIGYYKSLTLRTRLREDVIGPALDKGYEKIWLVGTSMGGVGALIYANDYAEQLAGLYLIAPYLGPEEVIDEVRKAGGPLQWAPPETLEEGDVGRTAWKGLRQYHDDSSLPVFMGWGRQDRFAPGLALASELIEPENLFTMEGEHDWTTWARLWESFLDRARPCAPQD